MNDLLKINSFEKKKKYNENLHKIIFKKSIENKKMREYFKKFLEIDKKEGI
jgi:hypothetical protein